MLLKLTSSCTYVCRCRFVCAAVRSSWYYYSVLGSVPAFSIRLSLWRIRKCRTNAGTRVHVRAVVDRDVKALLRFLLSLENEKDISLST